METADERVIIEHIKLLQQQIGVFKALQEKHARAMIAARDNGKRYRMNIEKADADKYGAMYDFACEQEAFLRRLVGWD